MNSVAMERRSAFYFGRRLRKIIPVLALLPEWGTPNAPPENTSTSVEILRRWHRLPVQGGRKMNCWRGLS
jgi:hypothetical protein